MTFQQAVRFDYGFGVIGEIKYDGPTRAKPGFIISASAANNIVGSAFTILPSGGAVRAGNPDGLGIFYGILANPKVLASTGVSGNPLAPTLVLPNNTEAEFLDMGKIVIAVPAACNIGDKVYYAGATGVLSTLAPNAAFTGVQATNQLTVTGLTAGYLGVGSKVFLANGNEAGYIESQVSGTPGGNGVYQLDTSATVASQAMTATSVAPAGSFEAPTGQIDMFPQSAAGIALAKFTN